MNIANTVCGAFRSMAPLFFICFLLVSILTNASTAAPSKSVAIVINVNGSACIDLEVSCVPVLNGSNIFDDQTLVVDIGHVDVVDLEDKTWIKLSKGSHRFESSHDSNIAQARATKLSDVIGNVQRTTASITTRSHGSFKSCIQNLDDNDLIKGIKIPDLNEACKNSFLEEKALTESLENIVSEVDYETALIALYKKYFLFSELKNRFNLQ